MIFSESFGKSVLVIYRLGKSVLVNLSFGKKCPGTDIFLTTADINIQVGFNMHLYDDIEDASSTFRGSISSFYILYSRFGSKVASVFCFLYKK